jgi:DNA end-binding protein Ku
MASTVWKGYISFGMVSVPIRLYAAARESHISFHQIHQVCGSRIKQQLFCPICERVVERSELTKGYPLDKDTNVLVTTDELKALEANSSEVMEIVQFIKLTDVDPIYYQTSYYTVPEDPGRRAYALMLQGMQQLNLAAVAKITMHQREQLVLVRPYHKGLVLHTVYYPAEVREVSEYGRDEQMTLQKQIESKGAGVTQPAGAMPRKRLAPVINLMDALKKSIEAREGQKPVEVAEEIDDEEKKPPQRATKGKSRKRA